MHALVINVLVSSGRSLLVGAFVQRRKGPQPSKMGRTPGPGRAGKGASRKTKLKCWERARCRRMVWMLKIVELVPPPWRQRIEGRGGAIVTPEVEGLCWWVILILIAP